MGRKKIYFTEEEKKEAQKEISRKWREKHKLELKNFYNTPRGRSFSLLSAYREADKKANRGRGDLTVDWVEEQIQKGCTYKDQCGTTDWRKIGLNRKDNSLPHTMENCEPCCADCNRRLHYEEIMKQIYQYTIDKQLIKVWDCINDCKRENYNIRDIDLCCKGKRKTHKGYIWSYYPL